MLFSTIGILLSLSFILKINKNPIFNQSFGFLLLNLCYLNLLNIGFFYKYFEIDSFFVEKTSLVSYSLLAPLFFIFLNKGKHKSIFKSSDAFHFIPATILIAFNPFINKSNSQYLAYILIIFSFLYCFYSTIKFQSEQYQESNPSVFSIKAICHLFFALLLIGFLEVRILYNLGILETNFYYFNSILISTFVLSTIYFLIYKKVNSFQHNQQSNPSIGGDNPIYNLNEAVEFDYKDSLDYKKSNFIKYEKTGLSKNLSLEYKKRILNFMENEKPYLNPDINLSLFSKQVNISRHHLSQVINEHFKLNFQEFVNKYRIMESIKLIENNDAARLNIKDIAYKSGFNSRTSFYEFFRRHIHASPTEYKKNSN